MTSTSTTISITTPDASWEFLVDQEQIPPGSSWVEIILSPLASVAASNGWQQGEEPVTLNIALSKNLIPPGKETIPLATAALTRFRESPTLRFRAERHLTTVLENLPLERGTALADRLFDAMLAVAQFSPISKRSITRIDGDEAEELKRIFHLLKTARDRAASRRIRRDSDITPPPHDKENAALPSSPAIFGTPTAPLPWQWAAGWDERLAESSFEVLATMHSEHEKEAALGVGNLNGVNNLREVVHPHGPDASPWVDAGVAVAPAHWQEEEVWIFGDLHGDAGALEQALRTAGVTRDEDGYDLIPDGKNIVFLGDLGDRGAGTLSVWLRVAALKARHPAKVQILRGNHEEIDSVQLTSSEGRRLKTPWAVPTTTNMEAYLMLSLALRGSLENLRMVYGQMPDLLVLPGGALCLHGSLPPRRKENDGWPSHLDPQAEQEVSVTSLSDLRKPVVRRLIRWTDAVDRDQVDFGWAGHGRGSRLFCAADDHQHWESMLGNFRVFHGHTHPAEGGRLEWGGKSLALNTSRHTAPRQAIARLQAGEHQFFHLDL